MVIYMFSLVALLVVTVVNFVHDRRVGEKPTTTIRGITHLLVIQALLLLAAWMTWSRLGGRFDGDLVTVAALNMALIGITRGQLLGCLTPGQTTNENVLRRGETESFMKMLLEALLILGISLALGILLEILLYP